MKISYSQLLLFKIYAFLHFPVYEWYHYYWIWFKAKFLFPRLWGILVSFRVIFSDWIVHLTDSIFAIFIHPKFHKNIELGSKYLRRILASNLDQDFLLQVGWSFENVEKYVSAFFPHSFICGYAKRETRYRVQGFLIKPVSIFLPRSTVNHWHALAQCQQ